MATYRHWSVSLLRDTDQTMSQNVKSGPLTKLNGGSWLHSADEDAVFCKLTNYDSWHAYQKKKKKFLLKTHKKPYPRNSLVPLQPLRVTPNLGSRPLFWNSMAYRSLFRLSPVSCRTTDVVNAMRLSLLVDNTDRWTLFTAFDRSAWDTFRHIATACC